MPGERKREREIGRKRKQEEIERERGWRRTWQARCPEGREYWCQTGSHQMSYFDDGWRLERDGDHCTSAGLLILFH